MSASTDSPLAKMAHTAVSRRNGTASKTPSLKGRSSISTSCATAAPLWDEHKERTIHRWTKDLEPVEPTDEGMLESRHSSYNGRLQSYSKPFTTYASPAPSNTPSISSRGPPPSTRFSHLNLASSSSAASKQILSVHPPKSPSSIKSSATTTTSRPTSPVIVCSYHPPPVPRTATSHSSRFSLSSPRIPKSLFKSNSMRSKPDAELPPASAFSFANIMENITRESPILEASTRSESSQRDGGGEGGRMRQSGNGRVEQESVQEALERIAEICARSRLSLADDYKRHVRPHGPGSEFLEQVPSGNDARDAAARGGRRGGRKGKSKAFETLETIYASSSSGASSEGKRKRKSAAEVAEEVRKRRIRRGNEVDEAEADGETERERGEEADVEGSVVGAKRKVKTRLGGTGQGVTRNGKNHSERSAAPTKSLLSHPVPPTLTDVEVTTDTIPSAEPAILSVDHAVPTMATSQPTASVPGTFPTWLPWLNHPQPSTTPTVTEAHEAHCDSYFDVLPSAHGSLKRILDATEKVDVQRRTRVLDAG